MYLYGYLVNLGESGIEYSWKEIISGSLILIKFAIFLEHFPP